MSVCPSEFLRPGKSIHVWKRKTGDTSGETSEPGVEGGVSLGLLEACYSLDSQESSPEESAQRQHYDKQYEYYWA